MYVRGRLWERKTVDNDEDEDDDDGDDDEIEIEWHKNECEIVYVHGYR